MRRTLRERVALSLPEAPVVSTYLYENWQLFKNEKRHSFKIGFDYFVYSDAVIEGVNCCELGPNTLFFGEYPAFHNGLVRHICTLRNLHFYELDELDPPIMFRLPEPFDPTQPPTTTGSNVWMYTGMTESRELLAVLSLEWGVRLFCSDSVGKVSPMTTFSFGLDDSSDHLAREKFPWCLSHWPHPSHATAPPQDIGLRSKGLMPAIQSRKITEPALSPAFHTLERGRARALVLAAGLYSQALRLASSDPNSAWLLFVSALETVGADWDLVANVDDLEALRLNAERDYGLKRLLKRNKDNKKALKDLAKYLRKYTGATRKFVSFCLAHAPSPPEGERGLEFDWENQQALEQALRLVYRHRSVALHSGTPFPGPMLHPSGFDEIPTTADCMVSNGGQWASEELPLTLHAFEHLTRSVILNWWRSLLSTSSEAMSDAKES